jgi:Ice-binding-like
MIGLTASRSNPLKLGAALLLLSVGAACGGTDSEGSIADGDPSGSGASADGANLPNAADGRSAKMPLVQPAPNSPFNGPLVAPGSRVNLGAAGDYAILAKSGISSVPGSNVTGNIGVSPAAASYITGFSLTADSSNVFSTSSQVTGKVYAADFKPPCPSSMTKAVGDMETAYTDAASRAPDVMELGAGNIGGMTLPPGVYKWGTGLLIPTNVTLAGNATDVWIFQISKNLTMASNTKVVLAGGAHPKNIVWQVAGLVDLGTTAHCEGIVLTQTAVTLRTGASINGRLLAQTAVNIASSTVVAP